MQYGLAILLFVGAIYLIVNKWIHRQHAKTKSNFDDLPTHTKKQQEFYKGENRPSIDFHGRLINMDEHADGIVEEK